MIPAVVTLESLGEARAAEIGAGQRVKERPAGVAPVALCKAVLKGDVEAARKHLALADSVGHARLLFVTEEESVTADADWELLRVSAVEGPREMCELLVGAGAELDRPQTGTRRTPLVSSHQNNQGNHNVIRGHNTSLHFIHYTSLHLVHYTSLHLLIAIAVQRCVGGSAGDMPVAACTGRGSLRCRRKRLDGRNYTCNIQLLLISL